MLSAIPAVAADYGADDSRKTGDYDADNSGRNARDRNDETVTPADQGGTAADRDVTAKVRKAIVDDDNLSTDAHNVKVVTQNGVVTLRGPVESASEKSTIAAKAKKVGGVKRVDNKLEIEKNVKK
jgi:osmotically-inducible protein OsmY